MFAFLDRKSKLSLYMDQGIPEFQGETLSVELIEFKEYYKNDEEALPHIMPGSRGISATTSAFGDASHAANKIARRPHTGYILFVKRVLIKLVSR